VLTTNTPPNVTSVYLPQNFQLCHQGQVLKSDKTWQ